MLFKVLHSACLSGSIWGIPKIGGYLFGGPNNKDYSILGSILGYLYFGKLPYIGTPLNGLSRGYRGNIGVSRGYGALEEDYIVAPRIGWIPIRLKFNQVQGPEHSSICAV